jgi:3-methylfumaryl-CoA hydratase
MSEGELEGWIGRTEEREDIAEAGPIRRLAALLDYEAPPWIPGILPPLGHWLYFLPEERQSALGPDGHAARGGFLPPVAAARRMWAGGRIDFLKSIPLGAAMKRRSTVADISHKNGHSGPMTFVTVRHQVFVGEELAIREEHDIVYRDVGAGPAKASASAYDAPAGFRRSVQLGPVELFRYSALTCNGHRIHYDRDYAAKVEGYCGLIVHGPLIATLLVNHMLRWKPTTQITRFAYRARAPLFDGVRFDLCLTETLTGARVWAQAPRAPIAMEGELFF